MDMLYVAILQYLSYLCNFDWIALPLNTGRGTQYQIYNSLTAAKLIDYLPLWKVDRGVLRWQGIRIDRARQLHIPNPELTIDFAYRKDEWPRSDGTSALAQELALAQWLDAHQWLGRRWARNSTVQIDGYVPDILSASGDCKIEVKGYNSTLA